MRLLSRESGSSGSPLGALVLGPMASGRVQGHALVDHTLAMDFVLHAALHGHARTNNFQCVAKLYSVAHNQIIPLKYFMDQPSYK